MNKLAPQAISCYNKKRNIVEPESISSTLRLVTSSVLRRLVTMETVPHSTQDDNPLLRRCKNCPDPEENKWHPATLAYFPPEKKGKDGLSSCCRVCTRAKQKRYRSKPEKHEHFLAYMKEYHDRPEVQEKQRAYNRLPEVKERARAHQNEYLQRPETKERLLRYQQRPETKVRINAYYARPEQKAQRKAYKEEYHRRPETQAHYQAYRREYYQRPEVQARKQGWTKAYWQRPRTRALYQATRQRRRALLRSTTGTYTPEQVRAQYDRQKGKCYYCQRSVAWDKYHVDHAVPLSRGGTNDISNIVIACAPCNLSKRDKLPHEFFKGGRLL